MSDQIKSVSVEIKPRDSRCRYWAKIIRANQPLPLPSNVNGADDIPGPYLRIGEEEMLPGDVLIEGEANHHMKTRGWTYDVHVIRADGTCYSTQPMSAHKAALKDAGMPVNLLTGSGDIAACVRIAHGVRMGLI